MIALRIARYALCALAGSVLVACGPSDPPSGNYPNVDHQLEPTDAEAPDATSGTLFVPDGTWVMWHETSTCVKALSVRLESLTQTLLVVKLQSSPGGVIHHQAQNCLIEQTPILGVATTIPRAVIDTIPPQKYVALLANDEPGSIYSTQRNIELWGVDLTDPEFEELPRDAQDPRVYDQDKDGKPGATLVLGDDQCSMHVVQRAVAQWVGTLESGTRITGGGDNVTTQVVLGATGGFCASQFDTYNPPGTARFVLQRVDGLHGSVNLDTNGDGQVDCDEVRAFGSEPFSPRTPDNARCEVEE